MFLQFAYVVFFTAHAIALPTNDVADADLFRLYCNFDEESHCPLLEKEPVLTPKMEYDKDELLGMVAEPNWYGFLSHWPELAAYVPRHEMEGTIEMKEIEPKHDLEVDESSNHENEKSTKSIKNSRHVRGRHPCQYCSVTCSRKDSLLRHLRNMHHKNGGSKKKSIK